LNTGHVTSFVILKGFEPSYQSLKRYTSDLSFSSTSRSFRKPIAVRNTSLGDLQWHVLWWPTHISLHWFDRIHSCRVVNNKLASAPDKKRCRRPALMTPSAYPLPVLSLFSLPCPQLVLPSLSSACSSFRVLSLSSPLFQSYCSIELTLQQSCQEQALHPFTASLRQTGYFEQMKSLTMPSLSVSRTCMASPILDSTLSSSFSMRSRMPDTLSRNRFCPMIS